MCMRTPSSRRERPTCELPGALLLQLDLLPQLHYLYAKAHDRQDARVEGPDIVWDLGLAKPPLHLKKVRDISEVCSGTQQVSDEHVGQALCSAPCSAQ